MNNAEALQLALDLDEADAQLSDWELEFLESMLRQLREGRDPSEKQAAVLERMEGKYL